MDRGVQAHNQLRLNLDVPYDVRHLEARIKPPLPVVIERLSGTGALQPLVAIDSGRFDPSLAVDPAASALATLSQDRLAAAQMLARRDLKQQRFVLDSGQRVAGRSAGPTALPRQTLSAPRRVPSVVPLQSSLAGSGSRLPAAARIASSIALATGRRTPDRPGSAASGRSSGGKSAPGARITKGDAAAKRRLFPAKAAASAKAGADTPAYGYDSAAAAGAKETAGTASAGATADGVAAPVPLPAEELQTGASQLFALQEHIRTIEGELKHLSSLAGRGGREDDAVRRLSDSHRGAIRALQSLAADMPNRKRSDGEATYRELSSVMKQLSQLCTQLELAGAESALSQDPRDAAKADVVAAGGIGRASPAFAVPVAETAAAAAAAVGLKPSRKASAGGKKVKGLPMKLPSERLYPRTGSNRLAATKKSASAGTAARRSPYAPKQNPVIMSPYLTKPLPVSLGSVNASRDNRGSSDAGQVETRRGAVHFSIGQTQAVGAATKQTRASAAADTDRYADDELRIEDGLLKPGNFMERLVEARRRYTDGSAIARGASGHGAADADDPEWLEEMAQSAYHEQYQRQQQSLPTLAEEAVASRATSRTALTNPASSRASALRLSAAPSAVLNRQSHEELAASLLEQQQQQQLLQLQGDGAEIGSHNEELKGYHGGSIRKPSAESLNNGLARMLEAKVSSNGDLLADMILSDLVEDTAREMAELEEEDYAIGDQPDAISHEQLCDQLLARISTIQTEHDEIRRRWAEMELYVRNTSPTVLDADETATTAPSFAATATAPQPYVVGNVELSTSSSAATSADAAQCREHEGDEGRALTFTRQSRAAPRERSNQGITEHLDMDTDIADANCTDRHSSWPVKAGFTRRDASAVQLSVPDSMLLSIADNLDEYKRYLSRTYQETTSEFDPARFAEECAERIQDDCIEQLAGELGKAACDIVDKLYKDEFLPLSREENEAGN